MKTTSMRFAGASMRAAPSPAVAGFRPLAMALAVAGAFAGAAQAQPTGAQAIHGKATLLQQGNTLVVTTQNGAGTGHSAINWQSFSIPGGTTTRFDQPNAASTSINRVLGNNPSQIFGTLSSNGKLVLVNPAGIAVGAGAVVDTAAFTASTLRMSDADALAGRLVFGDGTGGGLLSVAGQVIARHGDVVLIAPDVRVGEQALVQAPNGATLLAAGQKVALTGRGLEGIQLELRAPEDQAINLGTLQGDAVGIFASQLKHSGAIQATGVSVEGGKVVLKAAESVEIAGTVTATRGTLGGQVHATANKVMLRSGAVIDVSGRDGGGEALIGGGWQGQDSRIANAQETTVEAGAALKADAIERGNGGTIVAWSDGATRAYGSFSARGGSESGDGGRVETSGHYLDMQGQVDTRAPNGRMGELLLDPTNMWIANDLASAQAAGMTGSDTTSTGPNFATSNVVPDSLVTVSALQGYLAGSNVTVKTANASGTGLGNITVVDPISWTPTSPTELGLWADKSIAINAAISTGNGSVVLRADGGSITQTAPITASKLVAYAQGGSVTLTNAGNNVSFLAGYAGTSGGFSFKNTGNLSIEALSSANGLGTFNGIRSLGPVSIDTGGSLTINDTNYGIDAFSNAVTLTAGGAISEGFGAKLTAGSLTATAFGSISLTGSNSVTSFSAEQKDSISSSESINLNNSSPTGTLTLGTITNASAFGSIDIAENTGNIVINGDITSQWGLGLRAEAAGSSIMRTAGTVSGVTMSLAAGSGGIGSATAPILTSGSTDFYIGGGSFGSGPGGAYVSHTGDASLWSFNLAPDAPLSFAASGDVTVCCSTISTGTGAMTLEAGKLTLGTDGGATLVGGTIKLVADEMAFSFGSSITGSTSIDVQTRTAGREIKLGLAQVDDGVLELDFDTMASFSTPGVLRIGSTASGPLTIMSSIAPGAGTLSLVSGSSISQAAGATITAPKLALQAGGNVALNEANMVGEVAASLTGADGNFSFKNGQSLNVGAGLDGVTGVAVSGAASAIALASSGTLTQSPGALLAGNALVAEGGSILLTESNAVSRISATQTGSTTGDLRFSNSNAAGLTIGNVTMTNPGGALIVSELTGNVTLDGNVAGGLYAEIRAESAASGIRQLSGTVTNQNQLALLAGAGGIGTLATPIQTAGASTLLTLATGSFGSGAGQVYVNHSGANPELFGVSLAANAPFSLTGDSTLHVSQSVDTGNASLYLQAGTLNVASTVALSGGSVTMVADNMALNGAAGSITGGVSIDVRQLTAGRPIELGSALLDGTALQLGSTELASFSTPGVLRIGSIAGGDILIDASIAPAAAGVLSLKSGGTIQQTAGSIITAPKLALEAGGVSLGEANMVGEVAARLTGTNADFGFRSGQSLNVGAGLDGVGGVTLSGDANNFDPLNPNTVIALASAGTLTQSAGALLAGKAVYAEGASVILTQANPTGVIAGKATGGATGVFHYTSSNGIAVSTVNGFSGVQNAAGTGADAIVLNGTSVSQGAGVSIVSAGGLQVSASAGDVFLPESSNSVASLSGSAVGSFKFFNTGSLMLNGVSAGGSVYVAGGGALALSQGIVAGAGVKLTGGSVSQTAGASIVAGSGGLQVSAFSGGIGLDDNGNSVGFFSGSALGDIHFHDAGALTLGSLSSSSGLISITSAGALTATQGISAATGVDLGGSSVSQTTGASIVSAGGLLVNAAAGSVALGDSGNSVGSFSGFAAGDIGFYNAGNLTLGSLSASSGAVAVASGGALTVPQNIAAGNGIFLGAQGGDLNVSASLNAGSGGVSLASASGSVLFNGAAGIAGAGDAFFSAPTGAVRVASGTTTLASNVGSTEFIVVDGGTLNADANITIPNLLLAGGALQGADVTIASHLDWTGGTMAGSGKTIIGGSATADITGPVTAARPMVNDGSIFLWGSGNIAVGSGFSLANNGLFEILNDGGFSGGVGSIVNSGTFRKGSTATAATTSSPLAFTFTTGASPVEVASFSNTGTLEVMEGTLQFSPMAFTTNAGLIWLESGATLDNSNTTLANTGWIKGSGTLALGAGSLDNSGGLAPGGLGAIGSLAIQAATVNLQSGSTLLVDVADALNYDTLQVTGDVSVASGAGISPSTGSATLLPGDSFDVVSSSAGVVGGTVPTVSGFDAAFVASPASLRLSVPLPPAPAPAPVASGSPLVDRILEIVPEASPSLVSAMLSEQDNLLTTFTTLLLEEEQAQAKDAVVNEVSGSQICTP